MGVVYVVDDLLVGGTLAAKTFQPELITRPGIREDLQREADFWLTLGNHPHIVSLRYVESLGTQLYLFMDYVAPDELGRNCLTHMLSERALDDDLTARWGLQICSAMTHMQERGLQVHRDLKPDNVMIDRAGNARVTDFGLARAYGRIDLPAAAEQVPHTTVIGGVAGTPGYIAPEVVLGDCPSTRSDVYAFGLILAQMMTGKPWAPFTGPWRGDLGDYEAANLRIREGLEQPHADSPFADVLARCLAYRPDARMSSFQEVADALIDACARTGLSVPRLAAGTGPAPRPEAPALDRINALYNLGRIDEALALVVRLRRDRPEDPGLLTCEGVIRAERGEFDRAIDLLERACAIEPGWCGHRNNLGKVLRAAGRPEQALKQFELAIDLDGRFSHMWASKGNCLKDLGRLSQALDAYDQAVRLDDLDWAAWVGRAQVLEALARPVDAMFAVERALDLEPDDATVRSLQRRLGERLAEASAVGETGAIHRSNELYRQGRFQDGLRVVFEARLRGRPSADLWNNEGVFLTELGDYRAALRCFDRGLRESPGRSDLWTNKGRVYRRLKQPHEALQCHERAISANSGDPVLWTNKFACCLDLELVDEARECFRQACVLATSEADRSHCRDCDASLYALTMAELAAEQSDWMAALRYLSSRTVPSRWETQARSLEQRLRTHLDGVARE